MRSEEFYVMEDGKKKDAGLHQPILDSEAGTIMADMAAIKQARDRGVPLQDAIDDYASEPTLAWLKKSRSTSSLGSNMTQAIDITVDFRSDTPLGEDPDALSPTLREYHRRLWSKSLPNGKSFILDFTTPKAYLHHKSDLGEFFLSSDTTNSSFKKHRSISHIWNQIPANEMDSFRKLIYSIGNMIIFPGRKKNGEMTVNQERGINPQIKDRFDLTLECIRRYYLHQASPLAKTLEAYADFFGLFSGFRGYVDYFLLNDLVTDDYSSVNLYLPFKDFGCQSPYPESVAAYRDYLIGATKVIEARNLRILDYVRVSRLTP